MRTSLPHIKALDGLRGVAVVMILLFHAGHLRGGWLGVDLFFVLSGFLITSLLLSEWDTTGGVSLRAFWWRRGRRLLPALYALLIGVCAWAAVFAGRADIDRIREEGIATLFYVANWHAIYAGHDYWEIFRAPSPLDHTWSLAIEEQFYLFWPPIVIIVLREFRGSHRALWRTAVAMAVASAGWMLFLFDPAEGTARVYFGADTRAAATLLGAAVAASQSMRLRSWPGKNYTFGDAIAGAGFAVLLAGAILLDGHNPIVYRGGLFALTIASCGIIVGLLLAPNGIMSRTLSAPPIRAIGTISYGLYLWHWPIFITMTPERMGVEGLALTVERLLVTFAFASISFYGLEKPIRRGGFAGPRLWTTATVSVCTMLFLGWVVVPGGGASRLIKSKAVASATEDHNSVDVLLIGDSIPYILGPEFVKAAEQHNIKSKVMGIEACGALRTTGLRYLSGHTFDLIPCLSHRRNWIATTRAFKPPSVIIFEGWSGEGSKKLGGKWSSPCSSHYDSAYTRDLTDLVDKVSSIGSTAYIVTTPPPSAADFPSKYSKLWGGIGGEELEQLFSERAACQNRVKRQVASNTEAVLIDLEGEVCPDRACLRYLGDDLVRPDGMHFEGSGAAWASNWILSHVDATLPVPVAKLRSSNAKDSQPPKHGPAHRDQGSRLDVKQNASR